MRACKSTVFALVALTLEAAPAWAQDAKTIEVTPYVAVGSAAPPPVGAAVTFPVTSTLSVETDVAYRREGGIPALSSTSVSCISFRASAWRRLMSPGESGSRNTRRRFFPPTAADRHPARLGADDERWRRRENANE